MTDKPDDKIMQTHKDAFEKLADDSRDKAAEKNSQIMQVVKSGSRPSERSEWLYKAKDVAQWEVEAFKAGWDACVTHYEQKLESVHNESERLKGELIKWKAACETADMRAFNSAMIERDRWIEQAEKLAVALQKAQDIMPGGRDTIDDDPTWPIQTVGKALAEFEAFSKLEKSR